MGSFKKKKGVWLQEVQSSCARSVSGLEHCQPAHLWQNSFESCKRWDHFLVSRHCIRHNRSLDSRCQDHFRHGMLQFRRLFPGHRILQDHFLDARYCTRIISWHKILQQPGQPPGSFPSQRRLQQPGCFPRPQEMCPMATRVLFHGKVVSFMGKKTRQPPSRDLMVCVFVLWFNYWSQLQSFCIYVRLMYVHLFRTFIPLFSIAIKMSNIHSHFC